jgi:hypothetical protein
MIELLFYNRLNLKDASLFLKRNVKNLEQLRFRNHVYLFL